MVESLDLIIRELGWEKEEGREENYLEGLTAEEIIISILGTRQMKLEDFC